MRGVSAFGFPVSLISVPGAEARDNLIALETQNYYERRDETLDTAVWIAQTLGSRVDLVYLGGIAFNRTVEGRLREGGGRDGHPRRNEHRTSEHHRPVHLFSSYA